MKCINRLLKPLLLRYQIIIVTGTYWGDEGKGKIVDLLSGFYDWAIRYSGGSGAGHTLETPDGRKFIGHLIPSGVAQLIKCVLARGVFFDLKRFLNELADAKRKFGGKLPLIFIDKHSPVWTPWHELFEVWLEYAMGKRRICTTGKAIGPLAGLKMLRLGLRVSHLYQTESQLRGRLESLYRALEPDFDAMVKAGVIKRKDIPRPIHVARELLCDAPKIQQYMADTSMILHRECRAGARLLFEGAQAPGLDIDVGTWPFVSCGLSTAAGALVGSALALKHFAKAAVLMVMKVLPTRVGAGPFPSEIWDRMKCEEFALQNPQLYKKKNKRIRREFLRAKLELINSGAAEPADWAQYFQVLGYELGATTGRGRSIGWPDLMWLHYVIRINGPKFFALTRLDMLSGLKRIPVVVGYKLNGQLVDPGEMPTTEELDQIEPVIEWWDCWDEDISGIGNWDDLPHKAKQFVWKMEKRIGVPILLIGTGPARQEVIVRPAAINKRLQPVV